MQRVRIGLTGLGGVFLLVLAAAAFFGLARREPDVRPQGTPPAAGIDNMSNAEVPKEPLAELGVTPGNLPDAPAGAAPVPTAARRASPPPPTKQ